MIQKFIPEIPSTVKARFKGYHIVLTGPKEDVERAANGLLNYGFACEEEESEELSGDIARTVLTFYKKTLTLAVDNIAEMGFMQQGTRPAMRRKRDGRKENAIRNFHVGLDSYAQARRGTILAFLSGIREEIGERAEVVDGRVGRGLDEMLAK